MSDLGRAHMLQLLNFQPTVIKLVSPSEVTKAQLARIDVLDAKLGSYQTIYSEEALAAAKVADEALTKDLCLGPFHGIPFALKDIYELKGQITTFGSYEMRQRISDDTGTVVQRLLEAGGITVGINQNC